MCTNHENFKALHEMARCPKVNFRYKDRFTRTPPQGNFAAVRSDNEIDIKSSNLQFIENGSGRDIGLLLSQDPDDLFKTVSSAR
jgi:hypothetical protein